MMKIEDLKVDREYVNGRGAVFILISIGKMSVFFASWYEGSTPVEESDLIGNFLNNCKPVARLNRNFDLTGSMLFKAIYKMENDKSEAQRFIIAENLLQAEAEMKYYNCEYYTLDLIQEDISIVAISVERS